jgi:hypothetical protein
MWRRFCQKTDVTEVYSSRAPLILHRLGCAAHSHGHAPPHTFPTEEQRGRYPQRSLLRPSGSSDPRLPLLSQPARRSLCRAVRRYPRACPQPLWSWRASESRAARQHGMPTRAPPCPRAPRAHPHCPPVRLPARRTLWCTHPPETRAPAGVAAGLPLRTHAPPAAHGRDVTHMSHAHFAMFQPWNLIAVQHTAQHFLPPPRPSLTSCRRDCMNACGGCPHAAAPPADVRALARAPVQGPSSSR